MKNRAVERVGDVDAYQQEGQMTTFFRTDSRRGTVDSWSTRVASFRTAEIIIIRRFDDTLLAALALDEQQLESSPYDQADQHAAVTPLPRRSA